MTAVRASASPSGERSDWTRLGSRRPARSRTNRKTPARTASSRGMTGTFYRSSAPGVAPYVSEGSTVADGQRMALIEAMKTFNPVECDVAGTVIRILVEDGASVTPGMTLFEIDPA